MDAGGDTSRIATKRLMLRPPTPGDAVYVAELANDAEVARMTTRVRHPYRLADAQAFLNAMAQADPRRERVFVLEHPDFGPVGVTGLHRAGDLIPELGYWLGRAACWPATSPTIPHPGVCWRRRAFSIPARCARASASAAGRRSIPA